MVGDQDFKVNLLMRNVSNWSDTPCSICACRFQEVLDQKVNFRDVLNQDSKTCSLYPEQKEKKPNLKLYFKNSPLFSPDGKT